MGTESMGMTAGCQGKEGCWMPGSLSKVVMPELVGTMSWPHHILTQLSASLADQEHGLLQAGGE